MSDLPLMYGALAEWWPLLSHPDDYAEEAELIWPLLCEAAGTPPQTLLELGSGGGNTASHLKQLAQLTLVDLAPGMLQLSQALNPECEHHLGDMRTIDLGRQFDAVLIHDAIMYMLNRADLLAALQNAARHCRPGGAALFMPDYVQESFSPDTSHGGHDGDGKALRYFEWSSDADPADERAEVDYVYLLREGSNPPRILSERHSFGLFARATWLELLDQAGFAARIVTDQWDRELFVCRRL